MTPPTNNRGFTLLEVMVAIAISALLGIMAYGGLRAVIDSTDHVEAVSQRLRDVQFAMRLISQDIYQIVPRPIRDELGDTKQPALVADLRGQYILELSRNGWANPAGLPRSTQQRVAYRFEDGTLIRDHWRVLDRTLSNSPVQYTLIENVEDIVFRFMTPDRQWVDQWPTGNRSGPVVLDSRPLAIEMRLTLDDWGEITRIIEVPR